jgi:hypothetical protein
VESAPVRVLRVTGVGRPLLAVTALAAALRFGTLDPADLAAWVQP